MFNRGDKALYGQIGVCIVEHISEKSFNKNLKLLHYTLRPIYQHNNNLLYMFNLLFSSEISNL